MLSTLAGDVEPPAGEDEDEEEEGPAVFEAPGAVGCVCVLDISPRYRLYPPLACF